MGGSRWLMFKSPKERERAERFLSSLEGGEIDIEVSLPDREEPLDCGCYLDTCFTSKAKSLAVSYSFNWADSFVATIVAREITRRFDVRRIGTDAVGWYPDNEWLTEGPRSAKSDYGAYTTWAAWMKDYRIEWSRMIDVDERPTFALIEAQVVALFQRLDEKQGAAS